MLWLVCAAPTSVYATVVYDVYFEDDGAEVTETLTTDGTFGAQSSGPMRGPIPGPDTSRLGLYTGLMNASASELWSLRMWIPNSASS